MGSGGGTKTEYKQSPEQRQMYNLYLPIASMLSNYAQQTYPQKRGMPLGAPAAPTMPSMQQMVGNPLMPTGDWFSNLDPNIKQGVWAPWEEAADQLTERLGSTGQYGNARGGVSGAGAAGLGKFYADAGQNVGMQAWNMMQPGLQAEYGQQQTDYANEVARQQADYQMRQQAWGAPLGLPGQIPSTYSQGIVSPQSSPLGQAAPLLGGAGGFALGGPIGAMLGMGTGSILGGK